MLNRTEAAFITLMERIYRIQGSESDLVLSPTPSSISHPEEEGYTLSGFVTTYMRCFGPVITELS